MKKNLLFFILLQNLALANPDPETIDAFRNAINWQEFGDLIGVRVLEGGKTHQDDMRVIFSEALDFALLEFMRDMLDQLYLAKENLERNYEGVLNSRRAFIKVIDSQQKRKEAREGFEEAGKEVDRIFGQIRSLDFMMADDISKGVNRYFEDKMNFSMDGIRGDDFESYTYGYSRVMECTEILIQKIIRLMKSGDLLRDREQEKHVVAYVGLDFSEKNMGHVLLFKRHLTIDWYLIRNFSVDDGSLKYDIPMRAIASDATAKIVLSNGYFMNDIVGVDFLDSAKKSKWSSKNQHHILDILKQICSFSFWKK